MFTLNCQKGDFPRFRFDRFRFPLMSLNLLPSSSNCCSIGTSTPPR